MRAVLTLKYLQRNVITLVNKDNIYGGELKRMEIKIYLLEKEEPHNGSNNSGGL
jgi:hypothetical protein